MSSDCWCSVAFPRCAAGLSEICDYDISWSYSLTFEVTKRTITFMKQMKHVSYVMVEHSPLINFHEPSFDSHY